MNVFSTRLPNRENQWSWPPMGILVTIIENTILNAPILHFASKLWRTSICKYSFSNSSIYSIWLFSMPRISTSLLSYKSYMGLDLTAILARLQHQPLTILHLDATLRYPGYHVNSNLGSYGMFSLTLLQHLWLFFNSISFTRPVFSDILGFNGSFAHAWTRAWAMQLLLGKLVSIFFF